MKLRLQPSRSGVALIIVMISVVALSILAGIFAFRMKVEARLAMNSNNDASMEWAARSAAEYAKMKLGEEMKAGVPDSLGSYWAGGVGAGATGLTNDLLEPFPITYELGKAQITIGKLVDLERFANINSANEEQLELALTLMGVDVGDFPVIVNSILDWIDPDQAERPQGAESEFYEALEVPYYAKDGPIDDLSELLRIKGFPWELYDANSPDFVPAQARSDTSRRLGFNADVPVYNVGFKQLFTPISTGKINISTAGREVLQLLPGVDEYTAEGIIKLRAGLDGVDGTEDDIPFRNPGEIINAGINPGVVQRVMPFCDVRSRTFEAPITVSVGGYTKNYRAIIVRNNPRDLQVISFQPVNESGGFAQPEPEM
jgi:general secretion pathway protein K